VDSHEEREESSDDDRDEGEGKILEADDAVISEARV
jgi:hypothetical protein